MANVRIAPSPPGFSHLSEISEADFLHIVRDAHH
jgi:hypothetical protein